jgi:hypothetical protein
VNEGKASVETAMGLLTDFGAAITDFQSTKSSGFTKLSNGDILKLTMIRRSQERYETDLRNLMLISDPAMLAQYDQMIAENKRRHQEHLALMARKKKQRDAMMQKILVGGTTAIVGGGIAIGLLALVIKAFG